MAARTAPARALGIGLRVIPGRSHNPARLSLRQLTLLTMAVAMFFALIYSRIFLDSAAFELTNLEGLISEQESRFDELRLEVAQLESPERIYAEAQAMGMVLPEEGRTVYAPMPVATDEIGELALAGSTPLLATLGAP
jgi:cell division protein FtsL